MRGSTTYALLVSFVKFCCGGITPVLRIEVGDVRLELLCRSIRIGSGIEDISSAAVFCELAVGKLVHAMVTAFCCTRIVPTLNASERPHDGRVNAVLRRSGLDDSFNRGIDASAASHLGDIAAWLWRPSRNNIVTANLVGRAILKLRGKVGMVPPLECQLVL